MIWGPRCCCPFMKVALYISMIGNSSHKPHWYQKMTGGQVSLPCGQVSLNSQANKNHGDDLFSKSQRDKDKECQVDYFA